MVMLLILGGVQALFSQEPAIFRCLEVLPSGDVTLSWSPVINTDDFERYSIYHSPNGSAFSKIGELADPGANSYLHSGAQANDGSRHYFIVAEYATGVNHSDTLQTIYLQLDNFNFSEARLFWNEIGTPPPDGTSPTTRILKEYPQGNWFLTATVSDTLRFSEEVIVCNDSINYRIEVENASGCTSVSNVNGAVFKIIAEPQKPVIDSISINDEGHVVIGWEPVGNAMAYIIYSFDVGIWTPIDTVFGFDNTFYTDTLSQPCLQSLTYTVATIDTCGSSGPKDEDETRKSLKIKNPAYNACDESVSLAWNQYRGPTADFYRIWVAQDNGPFQLLTPNGIQDTNFIHQIPAVGSTYSYYVRAYFSRGTSTSCAADITSYSYVRPTELYLANVDVLPSDQIELTIETDSIAQNSSWDIYRTDPVLQSEILIGTISKAENPAPTLNFLDTTANPQTGYYTYFVRVYDSCGKETLESNFVNSIFLSGESINTNLNQLQWNSLEGWENGVARYYIYRQFDASDPVIPVDSVDGFTLEYIDDMSIFSNLSRIPVYWVEAVEADTNSFGKLEKARSNRISVTKDSEMYVATAFRPDGYSPEFKPVYRFYNGKYYLFQIFNRWGKLIFESSDPDTGWDGRYDGQMAPQGVYVYKLSYEGLDNSTTQKTGSFTVIY
jgi:gliding motility-associated-like protein